MNLIYFEGTTAHVMGLYRIYKNTASDKIEAKVIEDTLVLRKTQAEKAGTERSYFTSIASEEFLGYIRNYCEDKRIDALQFVEIAGVYYEMYSGDNSQIKRAIEYCKDITSITLDGGYIIYHIDDTDDDDDD